MTLNLSKKLLASCFLLAMSAQYGFGQSNNSHTFSYNNTNYEIIKEKKTWKEAAQIALTKGGFLAEINSKAEQDAIFNELTTKANINNTEATYFHNSNETRVEEGTFVWIGGNDIKSDGTWIWNGNNNGESSPFWQGEFRFPIYNFLPINEHNGDPVDNKYSNWSMRQPNGSDGNSVAFDGGLDLHDGLAIALTDWSGGKAGEWNDYPSYRDIYYVIEYPSSVLSVKDNILEDFIQIYPSPIQNTLFINKGNVILKSISIYNVKGQEIKQVKVSNKTIENIDLSNTSSGIYFVKIIDSNGQELSKKIVK